VLCVGSEECTGYVVSGKDCVLSQQCTGYVVSGKHCVMSQQSVQVMCCLVSTVC